MSCLKYRTECRRQAHLGCDPRVSMSTGRWKVHGQRKRVLGDGHGWIRVRQYRCRRPAHLIFHSGGVKATTRGRTQRAKETRPNSGMNRVGDSDHLAPAGPSSFSPTFFSRPPVGLDETAYIYIGDRSRSSVPPVLPPLRTYFSPLTANRPTPCLSSANSRLDTRYAVLEPKSFDCLDPHNEKD